MPASIRALLTAAKPLLAATPFAASPREAHLLLGHVLGWGEARLLAHDDAAVGAADERRFRALLARRLAGEPVAYLLGEKEFFGRAFRVDARVLIPRPETEHLVEAVLALGGALPERARVLDLGTGSGAVALTLALERPHWRLVAGDLSLAALDVARENARRFGLLGRVSFLAVDLASALVLSAVDLVVANLPYVVREEAPLLSPEVRDFEPGSALFADPAIGRDGRLLPGLGEIARLLAAAARPPAAGGLSPGARVALEIGYGQIEGVEELAATGPWRLVDTIPDYAGIPRCVVLARG